MAHVNDARRADIIAKTDADKRVNPLDIIGSTGLRQMGGFIDEEFLSRLRGQQGVKFYRQMMDNNSIVGAIMFIIKSLVRQVPWKVEAASDKSEAKAEAEFVEEALADMSHTFEDLISEVLSFLGYGWSYFELIYKLRKGDTNDPTTRSQYNDGRVGWRRVDIRSQDTLWRWQFQQDDGGLMGLEQIDPYAVTGRVRAFVPIEKALLFRTETTKGNPEGRSLLRPAVPDYHRLMRIQEIEAIGIERDLAGMPIFEVPKELLMQDASPEEQELRRKLEIMIQQVRVDERYGGLVPSEKNADGTDSGFKFKLLSTGGRRAIDTNEIVKRYESRIAMTFLCEFIMIGQEKVGTQSLFQGKSNLFGVAIGTMLDIISSIFSRFGIGRLMTLNKVKRDLWPVIGHGDVVSPDLDKLGTFVTALAQAGLLSPNKPLEEKLLTAANLPPPEEEGLEIFTDPTRPTPAEAGDMASGILSDRQTKAILDVNAALSAGKMDRDPALELLASALGMDTKSADRYLSKEKPKPEPQKEGLENSPKSAKSFIGAEKKEPPGNDATSQDP